jgi:hypothetical protein
VALATITESERDFGDPLQRRKQLALWLTRPDHPLTARVMVNRVWLWHFGQGLVSTPNDFGMMGQFPTHPELLDWLATKFVAQSWSLKTLHRLIMTSSTYRMASRFGNQHNQSVDPENHLLWRMNRRRLEAEALWDNMHAVAGTLNLKMGGRPVVPPLADDEIAALRDRWQWTVSGNPADHTRRGLYILVRRNFRMPMFEAFDSPVNSVSCPCRDVTTVAPQALWFLNNKTSYRQAQNFAARLVSESGQEPGGWIERAWRIGLGRAPTEDEKAEAVALLDSLSVDDGAAESTEADLPAPLDTLPASRAAALTKLCLTLFNLNEFAYID